MDSRTKETIESGFKASNDGTAHFGQVVQALTGVGVESYHVDFRTHRTTYYLPTEETLTLALAPTGDEIARTFEGEALRAAIRGAQSGKVMYPEFKRLAQQAGCVGYTVWLDGRHVTYFGRRGETHVERFPD